MRVGVSVLCLALSPIAFADAPETGTKGSSVIEEVTVTAQKREERLQDVPVPATALDTESLIGKNQVRLQDFASSVPGFTVAPSSRQATTFLAIRGLTTGSGSPSVGILIDDVPYGSTTYLGAGQSVPDIDPGDLARIEVLRGPQGTLYGASSLGGLVKFVTVDPSTDRLSGSMQVGTSGVSNGDGLGYGVRGSINVPVNDDVAVRASAFTRLAPGYIDNITTGEDGINEERVSGGRLTGLWKPSDTVSLKVNVMYQKAERDGAGIANLLPGVGELEQSNPLDTSNEREAKAASAILTAKLGWGDLTVLSGYNINSFSDSQDITYLFGSLSQGFFGSPGTALTSVAETKKFTQEVRLSMPLGERFDWLVGGFYTKEDTTLNTSIFTVDEQTGASQGIWMLEFFPSTYKEYAAFTDLTYRVTDRFDVQFGARGSEIRQTASLLDDGYIWNILFAGRGVDPFFLQPDDLKASSFTYLVTPRLKINPDLMVYARLASGYRAGGVNILAGAPPGYDPDETRNYEIGIKGDFLDRRLSIDLSAYYIEWKDIQLNLKAPTGSFVDNGGRAKSQGVELTVQSRPLTGLTLGGWVAWNDAVLTENLPGNTAVIGRDNDRLPYGARFSGKLSAQQAFPIWNGTSAFVGADLSYVGERLASFVATGGRPVLPQYSQVDLRTGITHESWTVNVFANNITDRRGVLMKGSDAGPPFSMVFIQPRTIGLNLTKSF